LDEWNGRRRAVAARYQAQLPNPGLGLPVARPWAEPVWHLFVVRHKERDRFQQKLAEAGVGTLIHYPVPPHLSGAYADMRITKGSLPIAEDIAATVLSLPIGPHLTSAQGEMVMEQVHKSI
jgi:dTDP-4-amino-4,6-dideoxygalactose transaminase